MSHSDPKITEHVMNQRVERARAAEYRPLVSAGSANDSPSPRAGATAGSMFFSSLDLIPISRWPVTLPDRTVETVLSEPLPEGPVPQSARASTGSDIPFASVVIVTLDNLVFTRLCLESVLANTEETDHEVIVVDNGSRDGTPDYLRAMSRRFSRLRPILNDSNRGFAAASNQGLAVAQGDALVLLNNDTIVPRGWLGGL